MNAAAREEEYIDLAKDLLWRIFRGAKNGF